MAAFRLNLSKKFREGIRIKQQRGRSGQALLPLYFLAKIENVLIRKIFWMIVAVRVNPLGRHIVLFARKIERVLTGFPETVDDIERILIDVVKIHSSVHFSRENIDGNIFTVFFQILRDG
jgi:hypothetical protein